MVGSKNRFQSLGFKGIYLKSDTMQWVLFLFLPFLIEAEVALAPGMYPPEEMNTDVQNVPRNPYQVMDDNTPQAYQFYYEKEDNDQSGPSPPTIPQPPPLPLSVSPPSSSHGSPSATSSASAPPAAHFLSSSGTSSEENAPSSSQLSTYESLEPEQKKSNSAQTTTTTKSSSHTLVEFTTSSPRTTARIPEGLSSKTNTFKPRTVVFASDEEDADPRSKVEQMIQEEHKMHEVTMNQETGSDEEYGQSGSNNKEPNNGNPLDYRPVSKTPNEIGKTNPQQWNSKAGTIHSGEQPPVLYEKSGSRGDDEKYLESVHGSYNKNQLERNGGTQGKHSGQYSHQITIPPDSSRSWVYEGKPTNSNNKRNCCACCGDRNREGSNPNNGGSSVPYDFSEPDVGEPKAIITDNQGYKESIQPGNTVQRPYSPEIPTLAPQGPLPSNSQPSNGYVPVNSNQNPTLPGQQPYPQQNVPLNYQPVGTYQPLYDSPSGGCPCAAPPPPQMCCQPVTPCCLPTIPCCPPPPPIPCCPQPAVCCQPPPPPCCPVQQTCCSQPVIPLCFRSCPSCPCRRRLHAHLRMKRSPGAGCQSQCTANGQILPGRVKRQSPGCKTCTSSPNPITTLFGQLNTGCGTCSGSHRRVKRLGCLPCLGRKKRDIDAEHHRRVKRLGCLPCLGKRKKRSLGNCHSCSNLGNILHRAKRTICSPCGGRKKREADEEGVRRAPCPCQANRGATSYRSSYSLARNKRETDESFDSVFTCDKSCCDYDKCDKIRAKRLDLN